MHNTPTPPRPPPRASTAAAADRGTIAWLALLGACCGLMPVPAQAAIVATSRAMPAAPAASGAAAHTVWHFALSLVQPAATAWPQAPIQPRRADGGGPLLHPGAVFGLRDFSGYVAGSCNGPAGWTCSVRLPGQDLASIWAADVVDAAPADGIVDLFWTYGSGPQVGGSAAGVALGLFTAASWHSGSGLLDWSARGGPPSGGAALWALDGQVAGPRANGVPEPTSPALAGLALLLAAGVTRIARQRRGPSRRQRRRPPVRVPPAA